MDRHETTHMLPATSASSPWAPPPPPSPRRPRVRLLAGCTLAVCALSLVALASVSSDAWESSGASLRQSVQFLQREPAHASTPSVSNDTASSPTSSARSTKGTILCLHDGIAAMGASLIRELRCLGNTEPIQVYHCFPDELSPASRALLTHGDALVEIVDVCTELLADPNGSAFRGNAKLAATFRGYWIKPLALVHTTLDEVVLLDADAVLMRDPAALRTASRGYARTGTLFFHDRIHLIRKFVNARLADGQQLLRFLLDTFDYARFALAKPARPSPYLADSFAYRGETGHEMDSSMVLVDKRRAGKALDVLLHLITEVRFRLAFSWGDKEAFWLAYELAQQDYFFSPWGLSLLDSVPNEDLAQHPDTLCGSMAHFTPTENATEQAELLYVNGKALLDPLAVGIAKLGSVAPSRLFNVNPTHVTPRYKYRDFDLASRETFECMDKLGATPLPEAFKVNLLRRRHHFFAAQTGVLDALQRCDV